MSPTGASSAPLLPADSPEEWLHVHLATHFDEHADGDTTDEGGRWLTRDELLADRAAVLRSMHDQLVDDGVPGPAAATYIAAWTAGTLADAVGFGLATASAGFVVDARVARWHQHPDGWMDRVDLHGCEVVVADGHPWNGGSGVRTADGDDVARRSVHALVDVVTPLIEACHGLARVGRAGLWNEVADALGLAVYFQFSLPVHADAVSALEQAVRTDDVPWKSVPTLQVSEHPTCGPLYVGQKGGCCLAYTRAPDRQPVEPDGGLSDEMRAYRERFPLSNDEPRYCSTCMFRDPADVEARHMFWLERHHAITTTTTTSRNP